MNNEISAPIKKELHCLDRGSNTGPTAYSSILLVTSYSTKQVLYR